MTTTIQVLLGNLFTSIQELEIDNSKLKKQVKDLIEHMEKMKQYHISDRRELRRIKLENYKLKIRDDLVIIDDEEQEEEEEEEQEEEEEEIIEI